MTITIDDVVRNAVALGNQSDFVGASKQWEVILSLCESGTSKYYIEALCGIARGNAATGDFHGALEQYSKAINTLSDDADCCTRVTILNNMAAMRARIGQNDIAVEV